jgi:hypothetical protein
MRATHRPESGNAWMPGNLNFEGLETPEQIDFWQNGIPVSKVFVFKAS